ncbi:bifunctional riboflavin kinase/FAD synthetase [Vulgatibacter incomptus]|uniref:Riboflavin biosynthesis protein n=1 Tax=Vulgatibacter incomptus TaxID=1391653 RepID=A0A0K1P9X1_9BACT|nr:bifunctional riboflavin kinase/FAD synthetase [Vulgatibacter incomptus]AKU90297.1 Riboflavin kinase [Vulgatibacter incomptus]
MDVFHSVAQARDQLYGCAVAIGNFDGVHPGHHRLLELARELSRPRGTKAVLLTFEPHPAKILSPDFAPPLIATLPRKLQLLEAEGLDAVVLQRFDRAYAGTSPDDFVMRDLLDGMGARDIVVGYDFTFGKGRAGTPDVLARLAGTSAKVHTVPAVTREGLAVSSSKIRELVLEGRVGPAADLLGRPFVLDGEVVPGRGRGTKIGVPTANVAPDTELLPAAGVYAVRVAVEGMEGTVGGAANIGRKPTFGDEELTVEVHLFDVDANLYGKRMAVAFLQRLRAEQRFASVEELVARIHLDIDEARAIAGRQADLPLVTVQRAFAN